jgi:CMP-N,N'-diacetyllegionaminic acid synthase
MSVVAFIPARGGSERIPRKNIRELAGHPLIAYAIAGAKRAGIFDGIYVSTEDAEIADVARHYGAEVIKRPKEYSESDSPDSQWIRHAIGLGQRRHAKGYVILRPTNPFRKAQTIVDAWKLWECNHPPFDSLRSVRPSSDNPYKMWIVTERDLCPFCDMLVERYQHLKDRSYDLPTQLLPKTHVQSGCIQIFNTCTFHKLNDHTGVKVLKYEPPKYENIDLNTEDDWILAEALIEWGHAELEPIE